MEVPWIVRAGLGLPSLDWGTLCEDRPQHLEFEHLMADDCHDGLVTRHDVLADQERNLSGLLVEEPGPVDDRPFKLPERRGLGCRILVQVIVFVYPELYVAGDFDTPASRDSGAGIGHALLSSFLRPSDPTAEWKGEQGQALRDGPRGPMPFSDRPLSSSRRSFRVGLTLELARRPKGAIPNLDKWKPWSVLALPPSVLWNREFLAKDWPWRRTD